MATDEDHSDFNTALYNALNDTNQFERLLARPEFRDQLGRICRRIANADDVADLYGEVRLKILNLIDAGLPPLKTGHQLFGWVAELANRIYLDQKRRRVSTMTCTDTKKHWPNSSTEVPINFIDEYMDHVEECAYHAELVFLEEKEAERELRSIFRLARGLDNHGHLLRGELLKAAIADQENRLASWKKEAQLTGFPFNHIALYNGGREIASCGRFLDFSRHESINDLDPQVGLQVRGMSRIDQKDVLLGFYTLTGVRHDGVEQLLDLDNGYTVGLRVIRLNERTFAVDFRCVDTETLKGLSAEQERTGDGQIAGWFANFGAWSRAAAVNWLRSNLQKTRVWALGCTAIVRRLKVIFISYTHWARRKLLTRNCTNSLPTPLTVQFGVILFAALAFENSRYLGMWMTTQFTKHNTPIHSPLDPQRPVMLNVSDREKKSSTIVNPSMVSAQKEPNNERRTFPKNSLSPKLLKYTSRIGQSRSAGTACRIPLIRPSLGVISEVEQLTGQSRITESTRDKSTLAKSKSVQVRNTSFAGRTKLPK